MGIELGRLWRKVRTQSAAFVLRLDSPEISRRDMARCRFHLDREWRVKVGSS